MAPVGRSNGENLRPSIRFQDDVYESDPVSEALQAAADLDYSETSKHSEASSLASNKPISSALQPRGKGLRPNRRPKQFAMSSLRRGSSDWHTLLRPFVSDLVFRSLEYRRYQSEVTFESYTCQAAVLFVDLSGYSKITAAIASRGAHTISTIVNAYLERLLAIVSKFGGDVVKFAGDAVLVVWEDSEKNLEENLLAAAQCVMEMQETAGSHAVEGTSLHFRIHAALSCGRLESEVFAAPNHTSMQRLYHSVGGESLVEISELVDVAKPGEVCVSDAVATHLGNRGKYRDVYGYKILTELVLEQSLVDTIDTHIQNSVVDRALRRVKHIEEEFIHPSVIRLLSHGGLSPTQISQMRNLCVLFIAMTSIGNSVNWLLEVASVLDRHRCPIVQIIDDDKGVHLVAAVNLYEAIPETSVMGLEVCRELVAKQVGCAIGMAAGSTHCGVLGSSSVACRWDVTGTTPVRAARLMQYAVAEGEAVAIDQSVYDDPMAATRLEILDQTEIKGSEGAITVYKLSNASGYAAFRVLETVYGHVHDDVVHEVEAHMREERRRTAIVVTGAPLTGKKIVGQRAAGYADVVPYLHLSDASAGFVQLATTIATWFQYVDNDEVRRVAERVLDHMQRNRWSRAHDECINLVDLALNKKLSACFLVDRVQFLDQFSLSLLRECLHSRSRVRRSLTGRSGHSNREDDSSCGTVDGHLGGKVCFVLIHTELYNWKNARTVVEDITRSQGYLHIPIVHLGEASREELRTMFRDLSDMEVEERWLDAYSEAAGFTAGYFIERATAIRVLSGKLWSEGKRAYAETTEELVLHIPAGLVRMNKKLPVRGVKIEVAMRFHQIFDELPPVFQTTAKILAVATRSIVSMLSQSVLWEVLNDLIADGIDLDVLQRVLSEMSAMSLIKIRKESNAEEIYFQSPALGDVAWDVSTPTQIRTIGMALINRLESHRTSNFRVPLVLATLHHLVGHGEDVLTKDLWLEGYRAFLRESAEWNEGEINKWKETIGDEIEGSGLSSTEILGADFHVPCPSIKIVGKRLPLLKIYSAPVSLGPMGHSLSVITRNTFHEFGVFHGKNDDAAVELREASASAAKRYCHQMNVVESFLAEHGFARSKEALMSERNMIMYMAEPAASDTDVQIKAATMLDEFVPRFVTTRLQRLYKLVDMLREGDIPPVLQEADAALRRAYEALRSPKCRPDAAQDALMILATSNWKPRQLPEYLPLLHYQTVARIRNKVLKRLSEAEVFMFKHQQTHLDLEAFLIVTAILFKDTGEGIVVSF